MTTGTNTYEGLAVPLLGESELVQGTLGTDVLTITGAASQTGDFLVLRDSSSSEKFVVDVDGIIEELKCAAIGSFDLTAQNAGTASFAVTGLTSDDVVDLSPREATDGVCVVDKVAAGVLQIRNVASEAAKVEFNYLVIALA